MVQACRTAGALLHTLDLGVVGGDLTNVRQQTAPTVNPQTGFATRGFDESKDETLFMFAAQTGGQFLHWTNDYTGALADLSNTSSSGYRLGFRPVNARKGANSIEVKLRNVPASPTISFRKGFSWPSEPANDIDSLRLADIIQNDIPQSGTPPAFAFTERPYIDVIVPARQLAKQLGAAADGDVLLYVFDEKGSAVDYREKKISIPLNPRTDMALREKLSLPPGKYVAKALMRVGTTLGFAKVAFTIPE